MTKLLIFIIIAIAEAWGCYFLPGFLAGIPAAKTFAIPIAIVVWLLVVWVTGKAWFGKD